MVTNDKNVTLEDQVQADKLEGIEQVDKDIADLVKRYNALEKRKKVITNEQDAIKELIKEYMMEHHAKKITYRGMDLATLSPTISRSTDWDGLKKKLGAEVFAEYVTVGSNTRLTIKK